MKTSMMYFGIFCFLVCFGQECKDMVTGLVGNVGDMSPKCQEMSVLLVNFQKMCL